MTATLSKALGAQGGAVLGSPAVVEHLVNRARPFIFDTGLAPAAAGGALAALERAVAREPDAAGAWSRGGGRAGRARSASTRPGGAVLSVPMPSPQVAVAAQAAALDERVRSAASGRRRCPTASPGCGSPPTPGSHEADWARAAAVLGQVVKEYGAL